MHTGCDRRWVIARLIDWPQQWRLICGHSRYPWHAVNPSTIDVGFCFRICLFLMMGKCFGCLLKESTLYLRTWVQSPLESYIIFQRAIYCITIQLQITLDLLYSAGIQRYVFYLQDNATFLGPSTKRPRYSWIQSVCTSGADWHLGIKLEIVYQFREQLWFFFKRNTKLKKRAFRSTYMYYLIPRGNLPTAVPLLL